MIVMDEAEAKNHPDVKQKVVAVFIADCSQVLNTLMV